MMDREAELAVMARLHDAVLSAKGAHRTQAMLSEQSRTVERIVESLRKRSGELTALVEQLKSLEAYEAAEALELIAADLGSGFGIAAGSMRRWVLANEACGEALNLTKVKLNAAIRIVLEGADGIEQTTAVP